MMVVHCMIQHIRNQELYPQQVIEYKISEPLKKITIINNYSAYSQVDGEYKESVKRNGGIRMSDDTIIFNLGWI